MGFNPLKEKGVPPEKQIKDWKTLNQKPYDKNEVHPYTRCRIITMNGAEMEAGWFLHQFARHETDKDLQRFLAMGRRADAAAEADKLADPSHGKRPGGNYRI